MKIIITLFLFTITSNIYSQNFVCSFDSSNKFVQVKNNFLDNDLDINPIVEKILNIVGLEKNFIMIKDNSINNCYAITYQGLRFIIYDQTFLNKINRINNDNYKWSSISILAHEIGHHLQGHTIKLNANLEERRKEELEADKFSGFILQSLGATLNQSLFAINSLKDVTETIYSTHPNKRNRIISITNGFNQSKSLAEKKLNENLKIIEAQKTILVENQIKKTTDELFYNKAQLCINQNNIDCAIDYITTVITIGKNNEIALTQRAYLKSMKGDYNSALNDYNKVITTFENKNEGSKYFLGNHVYYNRAITYEKMDDFNNAISDYKKTLELLGNDQITWLKLATVYSKNSQNELALMAFNKGFEKPIENIGLQKFTLADIYLTRSISYYFSKKADSSILNLQKAINNYPSNHPNKLMPFYYLGLSYTALQNYDKAILNFNNYIMNINKENEDNLFGNANYYLGLTYQKKYFQTFTDKSLLEKSLKCFTSAFKTNTNNADALYYRSLSYQLLLDKINSCADLKIACELGQKLACEKLITDCKN